MQAMSALDREHTLAPQHPEWISREPFKSVLSGHQEALTKFTEWDWFEIVAATHAGMSTEAYLGIVGQWLETAKHPRFSGHPKFYSMTSVARVSRSRGMVSPSAFAALRLMTNSNSEGCCTGRSEGLAPFNIRST